jgi:hypothetical protein
MNRHSFRSFFSLVAVLDDVTRLEEDAAQQLAPLLVPPQQELEVHPEMIALASRSFSRARRCSYHPIASASSMSDVIIRAKVRVFSESSAGGSWY